ncbi:Serine/threonine phosphatases family 2C catalytic domain containing protein [Klebsormidium nitens]|uniref:Serine/threonine phosphatases family 2C catalytic domain containing protein n=1 Tax=Klebsormidium nitens TaxID=105231 RepID=A0A1Y1HWI2_KLENI|nr:Serine/threonine phosphatases family 2C catalytic domain containing protein [Klebsormidium nitens]|eukprot:GAQ80208.1 Serine/threonine phosphatases family 2C catalytic domain containing protein [Klebsormidium nitens]
MANAATAGRLLINQQAALQRGGADRECQPGGAKAFYTPSTGKRRSGSRRSSAGLHSQPLSSIPAGFQRSRLDEGYASLDSPGACASRVSMAAAGAAVAAEASVGVAGVQGSGRVQMEDTHYVGTEGDVFSAGVFDGHGGNAVANFLEKSFWPAYKGALKGKFGEKFALIRATKKTYLQLDEELTAAPKGLFGGMRERGLGGSKCGATAATVAVGTNAGCEKVLVAANVGDSRVLLVRNGEPLQLTVDHTPDREEERIRIELKNPNLKKPLVVNVGGTWRVGGLLALSRAFGDVYLKDYKNKDGGAGGFGLIAEPDVVVETVTSDDDMVVLATDGIFEVLSNEEVVDFVKAAGPEASLQRVAKDLVALAQQKGTQDDITVILARL